jgi:hypothetical protein
MAGRLLARFICAFLPGGVLLRDTDGKPLILVSRNGTTSMTHEGLKRALEKHCNSASEPGDAHRG